MGRDDTRTIVHGTATSDVDVIVWENADARKSNGFVSRNGVGKVEPTRIVIERMPDRTLKRWGARGDTRPSIDYG